MHSLRLLSVFDLQDAMEIDFSNTAECEGSTSNAERKNDSLGRVRTPRLRENRTTSAVHSARSALECDASSHRF
jgi:hypothetical protein